jgi:hypothetical protein
MTTSDAPTVHCPSWPSNVGRISERAQIARSGADMRFCFDRYSDAFRVCERRVVGRSAVDSCQSRRPKGAEETRSS